MGPGFCENCNLKKHWHQWVQTVVFFHSNFHSDTLSPVSDGVGIATGIFGMQLNGSWVQNTPIFEFSQTYLHGFQSFLRIITFASMHMGAKNPPSIHCANTQSHGPKLQSQKLQYDMNISYSTKNQKDMESEGKGF